MKTKVNGKTNRFCDKCKEPLTYELASMKGKFGQSRRIHAGVTTVSINIKHKDGSLQISGEWCAKCVPKLLEVFKDSLLESGQ